MKIKLTPQEDEVLWLVQRKSRILDIQCALDMSKTRTLKIIKSLADKTGWELLNEKDINNGSFWKRHGVFTPPGER